MSFSTFGAPQEPPAPTAPPAADPAPGSRRRTLVLFSALAAVAVAAGAYAVVGLGAPGDDGAAELVAPAPVPTATPTPSLTPAVGTAPLASRNLFAALVTPSSAAAAAGVGSGAGTGSGTTAATAPSTGTTSTPTASRSAGSTASPSISRSISPAIAIMSQVAAAASTCDTSLRAYDAVAELYNDLVDGEVDAEGDGEHEGGPVEQGHAMGVHVLELQEAAASAPEGRLRAAVVTAAAVAAEARERLLAEADLSASDPLAAALVGKANRAGPELAAACSEALDPLAY